MRSDAIWRAVAIGLCAALPVGFYVVGDITDAFPGVLTTQADQEDATARPRAQGEDYTRPENTPLAPPTADGVEPGAAENLQSRLDAHVAVPVVGGNLAYSVVDVGTGEQIASRDATTARTPASTLKLLTATALLRVADGAETLPTTSVLDDSTLTLVGGGDMRLTEAQLGQLADAAAARVQAAGGGPITLHLDDTLFGPGINPAWGANGPAWGWLAPTAALAVDEGWLDSQEYGAKSQDPALDAANLFVRQLRDRGVDVQGDVVRAEAPAGGQRDEIRSAPLSDLVAHTLLISDNTTAEVLGRLLAIHLGLPATAEGAAQAVQQEITQLAGEKGLPTDGLDLKDTCGLAVDNRVPPELLAGVVADLDAPGTPPALRAMLTEVPISGLSGTLADRFEEPDATAARGLVRGKTGYLGGTSTLVGVASLPSGRTVGFSIVVHGFAPAQGAEAKEAVDGIASELVRS